MKKQKRINKVENNLFVGSTAELQKLIKKNENKTYLGNPNLKSGKSKNKVY